MKYPLVIFDYNGTLCNAEEAYLSNEHSVLYPGVIETLEKLNNQGVLLGIATHMSAPVLKQELVRLQIDHYFIATRCIGECPAKPHPAMIEEICDVAGGIDPIHTLMVGDTSMDIQMGQNAGAKTAAVPYGSWDISRLKQMNPTYSLEHFSDLQSIVLE